jgi:hypothetical protein
MSETALIPRWPLPAHDPADQPHFFFLITPPYSGSTAIAKLLDTSPNTMTLGPRGEGQWLVPGLCEHDRWDGNKKVDYQSVKAVWLKTYQERKSTEPAIDVVVEKSPPNMVRISSLASQFKRVSFLANNRNPYAHCASLFFRRYQSIEEDTADHRMVFTELARNWIIRSRIVMDTMSALSVPLMTYETFCEDPARILSLLKLPEEVADTVDVNAEVNVKDYKPQKIANQNERQIAKLSTEQINIVSSVIEPHDKILSFFGYSLL